MYENPRLDYLEGKVEEQAKNWDRLYDRSIKLDARMERLEARIDERIDRLETRIDERIDRLETKVDHKVEQLQTLIVTLDQKLDSRFDDSKSELSKQFRWKIGMMITISGLVAGVLARLH